jgi:hypothetical protein
MATDTVLVKGEGGVIWELSLPLHETIADKLRKGYLQRVAADGNVLPPVDDEDQVPGLPGRRPALNAVKAEWVGWAVTQGMTPDDADALTKAELIDKFGVIEPAPEPEPAPDAAVDVTPDPELEPEPDLEQTGTDTEEL